LLFTVLLCIVTGLFLELTFAAGRGQRIAVFAKGRRTGSRRVQAVAARSLLVVGEIGVALLLRPAPVS